VTAERALRADAQRNLELILEAAAAEFAEHGLEVCVADIAQRAGVGQATIFRRFQTKEDLIVAVAERKLNQMYGTAQEAAGRKRAWDGLRDLMQSAVQMHLADRGLSEAIHERLVADPRLVAKKAELMTIFSAIVERAKAEGDLRQDISPEDVFAFCCAAAQAGTMAPSASSRAWKRYLAVITDGMRAT